MTFNLSSKIWFNANGTKGIYPKDVKEFINQLKENIDGSADKTDIWANERWDKFRKILLKEINKLAGDELI